MSPWSDFALDAADRTPVHAQLERGIRSAIAAGRLAVGNQLPTVRQLAVDLKVNANTVAKVYAHLERAGVLETRRGVGTFIAARTPNSQEDSLRRTELNRLVDRFLADLSHHGFGVDDALPEIERRRQQGA
ncbi:MAG TPA: GntR family transcriptional regulator [Vicinamibacterales bacterium]|nr:GntR family transcriptional regulator [Vicinamibacterales bacterium]